MKVKVPRAHESHKWPWSLFPFLLPAPDSLAGGHILLLPTLVTTCMLETLLLTNAGTKQ